MGEQELMGLEVPAAGLAAVGAAFEKCGYTTSMLRAMASWLRDNDDRVGAAMLGSFAAEFAEHEAGTL